RPEAPGRGDLRTARGGEGHPDRHAHGVLPAGAVAGGRGARAVRAPETRALPAAPSGRPDRPGGDRPTRGPDPPARARAGTAGPPPRRGRLRAPTVPRCVLCRIPTNLDGRVSYPPERPRQPPPGRLDPCS